MYPIHLGPAVITSLIGEYNKGPEFALLHVMMRSETYTHYYKTTTKDIILDNSVYELKQPLDFESLKKYALKIARPGRTVYVVLPDILHDFEYTMTQFEEYLNNPLFNNPTIMPMPVAQGKTAGEVLKAIAHYEKALRAKYPEETPFIAIPKLSIIREDIINGMAKDKKCILHMFGCNSMWEWGEMCKNNQIASSDGFLVSRLVLDKERFGENWGEQKFFYIPKATETVDILQGCSGATNFLEAISRRGK